MRGRRRRGCGAAIVRLAGVAALLLLVSCSFGRPDAPAATPAAASEAAAPRAPAPAAEPALPRAFVTAAPSPTPAPPTAAPPRAAPAPSDGAPGAPLTRVGGEATVLSVIELSVLDVLVAGDVYRVRLAGVALPDIWGVVGCYGEEARLLAEALAPPGSALRLETAEAEGGDLPAVYAWSGEGLLNERIVARGYALVRDSGAGGPHAAALIAAERAAARAIVGLWGAAVGIDSFRHGVECESLSGYFSAAHVGTAALVDEGVPYGHHR